MTRLRWDQLGKRFYETGVDRGVLYLPDNSGVPWNGLTAVEQDASDVEISAYHFDGVKYQEVRSTGEFSASISALTYPDEFLEFDGVASAGNGMFLDNQPVEKRFNLSYRTRVGNDVEQSDLGYKIHILYNLTAKPDTKSYATIASATSPSEFGWLITGIPVHIPGHKPTVHVIFDSRDTPSDLLARLEELLYGRDEVFESPEIYEIDGGTPFSSGEGVLDGGTPFSSGEGMIGGGVLGAPPRFPTLQDLIDLFSN